MFPREVCLHRDPSCVYDLINWDGKKYILRNDAGERVYADHHEFTCVSQAREELVEAGPDGKIRTVAEMHGEGVPFEFIRSGSSSHAEATTASHPRKSRERKDRPTEAHDEAKLKVREALAEADTREKVASVGSRWLGETSEDLLSKYSHLDNGRFRMTIGNRMKRIALDGGPE